MYAKDFPVGKRIREERLKKHYTQEQLAEKCNLTPNYISKVENGIYPNISIHRVLDICNALDIPMAQLFMDDITSINSVFPQATQELIKVMRRVDEEELERISQSLLPVFQELARLTEKNKFK